MIEKENIQQKPSVQQGSKEEDSGLTTLSTSLEAGSSIREEFLDNSYQLQEKDSKESALLEQAVIGKDDPLKTDPLTAKDISRNIYTSPDLRQFNSHIEMEQFLIRELGESIDSYKNNIEKGNLSLAQADISKFIVLVKMLQLENRLGAERTDMLLREKGYSAEEGLKVLAKFLPTERSITLEEAIDLLNEVGSRSENNINKLEVQREKETLSLEEKTNIDKLVGSYKLLNGVVQQAIENINVIVGRSAEEKQQVNILEIRQELIKSIRNLTLGGNTAGIGVHLWDISQEIGVSSPSRFDLGSSSREDLIEFTSLLLNEIDKNATEFPPVDYQTLDKILSNMEFNVLHNKTTREGYWSNASLAVALELIEGGEKIDLQDIISLGRDADMGREGAKKELIKVFDKFIRSSKDPT